MLKEMTELERWFIANGELPEVQITELTAWTLSMTTMTTAAKAKTTMMGRAKATCAWSYSCSLT
jgi:hypothetical protein